MDYTPYSDDFISALLPFCWAGRQIWTARVPLICFQLVEWHYPDRVVRQFHGYQRIPPHVQYDRTLHEYDLRGRTISDWTAAHAAHIAMWTERRSHLVRIGRHYGVAPEYIIWYKQVSRLYLSHAGACTGRLVSISSTRQLHFHF